MWRDLTAWMECSGMELNGPGCNVMNGTKLKRDEGGIGLSGLEGSGTGV
jgi:hypothetical protein